MRDVGELAGDAQHRESADYRDRADEQRQQGGDESPVDPQRDQEQQRECEQLGTDEVAARRLVALGIEGGEAAQLH